MNLMLKKLTGVMGLLLLSLCITTASAQFRQTIKASSNYKTKELKIGDFNQIQLLGSPTVVYTQSTNGKTELKITGSDNLLDLVECKVANKLLTVKFRDNQNIQFGRAGRLKILVSSPSLKDVRLQGSGDVILNGVVKCTEMGFALIGSGDIKADELVCAGNFVASLQGSGDVVVQKKIQASDATLKLIGSGDLAMNNLIAKSATVSLQGSGDLSVRNASVTGNVNVKMTGSGDLDFNGVKGGNVVAELQGSGDLTIAGTAKQATLKLVNSGDLNAANLKAVDVDAYLQGSGDISCFASGNLKCSINGSGDIGYKGNPANVQATGRNKPRRL